MMAKGKSHRPQVQCTGEAGLQSAGGCWKGVQPEMSIMLLSKAANKEQYRIKGTASRNALFSFMHWQLKLEKRSAASNHGGHSLRGPLRCQDHTHVTCESLKRADGGAFVAGGGAAPASSSLPMQGSRESFKFARTASKLRWLYWTGFDDHCPIIDPHDLNPGVLDLSHAKHRSTGTPPISMTRRFRGRT